MRRRPVGSRSKPARPVRCDASADILSLREEYRRYGDGGDVGRDQQSTRGGGDGSVHGWDTCLDERPRSGRKILRQPGVAQRTRKQTLDDEPPRDCRDDCEGLAAHEGTQPGSRQGEQAGCDPDSECGEDGVCGQQVDGQVLGEHDDRCCDYDAISVTPAKAVPMTAAATYLPARK